MATFELVPDFTESSGENGPESCGMEAAGDRAAPGGVKLCFTQKYLDGAKSKVKCTEVKLAIYLAICNLEALALSTDHVGMSKWHLLCLFLVFRYKLFLVLKRTTAPEWHEDSEGVRRGNPVWLGD